MCFNTVAVLFLLEVDNITFHAALCERLRARVEEQGHVQLSDAQADALARTKPVHIVLIMVAWLGALGFITYVGFTHQGRPCDQPLAMWCVVFGLSSLVLLLGGMGCAGLMKLKERPAIITGTLAAGSIFVFSWLVVGAVRVFASGGTKACDPMLFHATQYLVIAMLSLLGLLVSSFCFCCSARSLGLFGAA